eukprot:3919441-Rhodomonas_salina.1
MRYVPPNSITHLTPLVDPTLAASLSQTLTPTAIKQGTAVKRNVTTAVQFLQKSARKNHTDAQEVLAAVRKGPEVAPPPPKSNAKLNLVAKLFDCAVAAQYCLAHFPVQFWPRRSGAHTRKRMRGPNWTETVLSSCPGFRSALNEGMLLPGDGCCAATADGGGQQDQGQSTALRNQMQNPPFLFSLYLERDRPERGLHRTAGTDNGALGYQAPESEFVEAHEELGYDPTRPLCHVRYWCRACTYAMSGTDVGYALTPCPVLT